MNMELFLKSWCHWALILLLVNVALIQCKEETTQAPDTGNQTASEESGTTKDPRLTGDPRHDYIYDPNLPRELNGYDLGTYPFYSSVPTDITFKCDGRHDGYYASIPHHCQLFHLCVHSLRHDFLCANYTVFDQTQFICHFVNSVNCSNSESYYDRNNELYVTTTTEIPEYEDEYEEEPRTRRPRRRKNRRRKQRRRTTTPPPDEYYDYYEEEEAALEEDPVLTEEVVEDPKPARRSRPKATTTTTISTPVEVEAPSGPKIRKPQLRAPRPLAAPPSTAHQAAPTADEEQALPTVNQPVESRTGTRQRGRQPKPDISSSPPEVDLVENASTNNDRPLRGSQFRPFRGSAPRDTLPDIAPEPLHSADEPIPQPSRGSVSRQAVRNVAPALPHEVEEDRRAARPARIQPSASDSVGSPRATTPQRRLPPQQASSALPDPTSIVAGILSGFHHAPAEVPVEVPLQEQQHQPSQVPGRQATRSRAPVAQSAGDIGSSISAEGVLPNHAQGPAHTQPGSAGSENAPPSGKRRVQRRRKIRKQTTTTTTTTTTTAAPLQGEYEYEYVE